MERQGLPHTSWGERQARFFTATRSRVEPEIRLGKNEFFSIRLTRVAPADPVTRSA